MVLFEGVWFNPLEENFDFDNPSDVESYKKFKFDLRDVLTVLENEFLNVMYPYFNLSSRPENIEIQLHPSLLPAFNFAEKNIRLPFNYYRFGGNRCFDSLKKTSYECAHEIGHYLHCCVNSKICNGLKKNTHEWCLVETIAELSALTFFDLTERKFSEIIGHRQDNSLMRSIYEFYSEKGIDYSLMTIKRLANLDLEMITLDLYKIKKNARMLDLE